VYHVYEVKAYAYTVRMRDLSKIAPDIRQPEGQNIQVLQYEQETPFKISIWTVGRDVIILGLLFACHTSRIRERKVMILFILLIMAAVALSASSTPLTNSPRRSTF